VRKDIAANLLLFLLDEIDIREHAVFLELLRQFRCRDGAAMKTGKRNELEDEAKKSVSDTLQTDSGVKYRPLLRQIPDERLELSICELLEY
jgi:hypothetical protein